MTEREIREKFRQHDEAFKKIGKVLDDAARKEGDAQMRKAVDAMSQIQGKQIDRAAAYTNLMLIGGYAGMFTIWSNVKGSLPAAANLLAASLIGISLTAFIAFEIYKMIVTGRRLLKYRGFLVSPAPLDLLLTRLDEIQKEDAKLPLAYMPIWIGTLGFCVLTILGAIALLGYNFFAGLIGISMWPS